MFVCDHRDAVLAYVVVCKLSDFFTSVYSSAECPDLMCGAVLCCEGREQKVTATLEEMTPESGGQAARGGAARWG